MMIGQEIGNQQNLKMATKSLWNNGEYDVADDKEDDEDEDEEEEDEEEEQQETAAASHRQGKRYADNVHGDMLLRNHIVDTAISCTFRNKHIYAICMVHSVYVYPSSTP